jgi:hypothetical protein
MGEEFPLDPNQVQPPQEGQFEQAQESDTTHIEVTSHEGEAQLAEVALSNDTQESEGQEDGRIQDVDKARDMAEAGDTNRTKAMESRDENTARRHEKSFNSGSTPEYRAESYDKQADKAENEAGEVYDEAMASEDTNDVDKAKRMIKADRYHNTMNLAAPTGVEEGNKYDSEIADEQLGKPRVEALKNARDFNMTKIFLRYSHVIAENYRKHGDELTVNLKALESAYNFTRGHGRDTAEYGFGKYVTASVNTEKDGAIDITTSGRNIGTTTEKWHIPMFDYNHNSQPEYYRPHRADSAYYEVTETTRGTEDGFDKVVTTKTRALGEEDLDNLGKLFGKLADYKAAQRANTLYSGDEGYEEALAEANLEFQQ